MEPGEQGHRGKMTNQIWKGVGKKKLRVVALEQVRRQLCPLNLVE